MADPLPLIQAPMSIEVIPHREVVSEHIEVELSDLSAPIWEQQFFESDEDYGLFLVFLRLNIADRRLNTFNQLYYNDKASNTIRLAKKLFKVNHWPERALAHDQYLSRQADEEWLRRDLERREKDWKAGDELRSLAMKSLQEYSKDEDFRVPPFVLPAFLKMASQLQAEAVPEALNKSEIKEILDSLPPERRATIIKTIAMRIE